MANIAVLFAFLFGLAVQTEAVGDGAEYLSPYYEDAEAQLGNMLFGDEMLGAMRARDLERQAFIPMAFGPHLLSGGAGEGIQSLGPAGEYPNFNEIKSSTLLPAYCEPPNPCPIGYTSNDGCQENVPNTAEFSRDYQKQQDCPCDSEHMFHCKNSPNDVSINDITGGRPSLVAKKFHIEGSNSLESYQRSHLPRRRKRSVKFNPYLQGPALAKRGAKKWHASAPR